MKARSANVSIHRVGFTLIEIVVILAIIGVLGVLVLSSVQAVRASSRKIQCANALRQIGIALNSYATAVGCLPPGRTGDGFSHLVMILPNLGLLNFYNSFNFSAGFEPEWSSNATTRYTTVSLFLCPSDGLHATGKPGGWTNYAGNMGVGVQKYGYNGVFRSMGEGPVTLAMISDGASHTAAMSEWLTGPFSIRIRDPIRSTFLTPDRLTLPEQFDSFSKSCAALNTKTAFIINNSKGLDWSLGDFGQCFYNHTLQINKNTCLNGGAYQKGAWTASSGHSGGANVLFVDGTCRFLRETTALAVWRALGSRNGREVISDDSF